MFGIKSLLNQVKIKIEETDKIAFLRDENFNVFSILRLERADNKNTFYFLERFIEPIDR